jgi:DNA modification methylase
MIRILQGDCRAVLTTLPTESAHCCVTSPPYYGLRSYLPNTHPDKHLEIGAEPHPDEYVAQLVAVFREVRRVLHPSGTLFLNLGDSYAGSSMTGGCGSAKPKDLLGIPWQVAFALRADGWWLRSAIVWSKPNPMPESCRDRPTSSYEMVFLLAKDARYFWDADAVAEPAARTGDVQTIGSAKGRQYTPGPDDPNFRNGAEQWGRSVAVGGTRNARNVLTFANEPYAESHFAVMPSALADWCIRAGASEAGCCPYCRSPLRRIVEKGEPNLEWQRACGGDASGEYAGQSQKNHNAAGVQDASDVKRRILEGMRSRATKGWEPTCDCEPETARRCVVLDPFGGPGTTALTADRLGRDAVSIELNAEFVRMAERRLRGDAPLFAEIDVT